MFHKFFFIILIIFVFQSCSKKEVEYEPYEQVDAYALYKEGLKAFEIGRGMEWRRKGVDDGKKRKNEEERRPPTGSLSRGNSSRVFWLLETQGRFSDQISKSCSLFCKKGRSHLMFSSKL